MSFLRGTKESIEVNVLVLVDGDLGKVTRVTFKATFKRLTVDESKELLEKNRSGAYGDDEVIRDHLLGWRDFGGKEGIEVEYTPDNLDAVMQEREYRIALIRAFMQTLLGKEALEAKN